MGQGQLVVPLPRAALCGRVMNAVSNLTSGQFSRLSLEEKIEVKRLGPDRPYLEIQITIRDKGKEYVKRFSKEMYDRSDWLCGCPIKQAFFCFPCLLFGDESAWTKSGVIALKHLPGRVRKHEACRSHLECALKLGLLGTTTIASSIDSGLAASIKSHNQEVEKNRYVLSKIIDCIKLCGFSELPLRGRDESVDSANPGVFRALIDLVATLDPTVSSHLEKATVFKGTSKSIQNDLLQSMLSVVREVIHKELTVTDFVAIESDDTTDTSSKSQNVLVFRYLVEGELVERFYSFVETKNTTADGISAILLDQLNGIFPDEESKLKLIAQSYDGASVMSGAKNGVQKKVRDQYKNAHYIHCYAHKLNLIMQQAVSCVKQARIFFSDLSSFAEFFSHSPKRLAVLDEIVGRRVPRSSGTRWNFHIRSVCVVFENLESLACCLDTISESSDFDDTVSNVARGLARLLIDRRFLFFLYFFQKVMPHVDILFNQMQTRSVDSVYANKAIDVFVRNIGTVRESVDLLDSKLPVSATVTRTFNLSALKNAAYEVCDVIIVTAKDRFAFTKHLVCAKLFHHDMFPTYRQHFPEDALQNAVEAYPVLEKARLRTELSLVYTTDELSTCTSALQLLRFFQGNNLSSTFCETVTLLKILVTTPMTTAEPVRCFSTLKRIKSCLRNRMGQERLCALAMLTMEKELVRGIPDFNSKVIENFANMKERRAKFLFK